MQPSLSELSPGHLVELRPGVRRLIAPNGGPMTGPGTNTYLLGENPVAVIDPGPVDSHITINAYHRTRPPPGRSCLYPRCTQYWPGNDLAFVS